MANESELQLMETSAPPKRKSKMNLLLMAMLVLTTASSGFFGWRYFTASTAKPGAKPAGQHEEATASESEAAEAAEEPEAEASAEHKSGESNSSAGSAVLNFEPFLVNLADRDAFRYLRVTIRLQVKNKTAAEKIASTDVYSSQIRDTILGTLSTKVSDQIITSEGKDELKKEISEKLNAFLPGKPIKAVFFTDFVVQL